MNRFKSVVKPLTWSMALLLPAFLAGCGGGGGGGDSGQGPIVPGAACTAAAGPTIPTVTLSAPTSGNQVVATSTSGVNNNGKSITATFSLAMNPATINANTFTLTPMGGAALVPVSVLLDATQKVATLTTSQALSVNTSYAVNIAKSATSATGTPLGCAYAWTFKTATTAAAAPAAIGLGLASSFGLASQAGLTSTGVTVINGDVALFPLATCTDATGNAGASQTCLLKTYSSVTGMTVNGSIFFNGDPFDGGLTASNVTNDLHAGWVDGQNEVDTQGPVTADQLGGQIFFPGVYHNAALGLAAGTVATLDAQNDADAIFIFKVDSSFVDSGTLLLRTEIKLINGAQARNVYFVTGLDVTIGSGTTWNGNVLAGRTVTINDGSTMNGRALAGASGAGALTLTGAASPSVTTVNVP
jgi:hypothetical protein